MDGSFWAMASGRPAFWRRAAGRSAAVLAIAAAASAVPEAASAQPVEYVRVCDIYGTGFFYIPGTESCADASLQPYRVQTEFGTAATNVGGPDPTRNSVYGIGAFGVGRNSVAIGNGAWSGGDPFSDSPGAVNAPGFGNQFPRSAFFNDNTTAIGQDARAGTGADGQDNATAVGQGSRANALDATAIGQGAIAGGTGSTALGRGAEATFAAATAVGAGASAVHSGSSAIGSGAFTTRADQVVLGTAGDTVSAPGIASAASRAAQTGPLQVVTSDAEGNLATASFDAAGVSAFGGRLDSLDAAVSSLQGYAVESRREARQGIAAAMAMVPAPMPSAPGVTSWTLNTATFESEWAGSAAVSHRLDVETPFSLNAAYSYGGGDSHGFRLGVASEF